MPGQNVLHTKDVAQKVTRNKMCTDVADNYENIQEITQCRVYYRLMIVNLTK